MKKKILVISIIAVFMLVVISLASAIDTDVVKPVEQKESPLYRARIRQAIRKTIEYIKSKYIGERVFFLPFQWLRNKVHYQLHIKTFYYTCFFNTCLYKTNDCFTCLPPPSCD